MSDSTAAARKPAFVGRTIVLLVSRETPQVTGMINVPVECLDYFDGMVCVRNAHTGDEQWVAVANTAGIRVVAGPEPPR